MLILHNIIEQSLAVCRVLIMINFIFRYKSKTFVFVYQELFWHFLNAQNIFPNFKSNQLSYQQMIAQFDQNVEMYIVAKTFFGMQHPLC